VGLLYSAGCGKCGLTIHSTGPKLAGYHFVILATKYGPFNRGVIHIGIEDRGLSRALGILGCILLAYALVDFLSFYLPLLSIFQQILIHPEPADPRLIAGEISSSIVSQFISSIYYIVPIIFISLASFKYKLATKWYTLFLRVFGFFLLLTPIANSIIGVYVLYLSWRKHV